MKKNFIGVLTFSLTVILMMLVAACNNQKDPVGPPSNGTTLNTTSYVAIGNSLTAGYQSGALFASAQKYSYPALLAQQMLIGGFQQPTVADPGIGGRMRITGFANGVPVITYDPVSGGLPTNSTLARPYNNLGIPGSVLWIPNPQGLPISDLTDSTDFNLKYVQRANPFFPLVLRSPAFGKSILAQAKALSPTFMTFWLGNNDVLGYATSGGGWMNGAKVLIPTPAAIFDSVYKADIAQLQALNPNLQLVLATIPDVTSIPFFTTVSPYIPGTTTLLFGVTDANSLVTLRAQALMMQGYGFSPAKPLPDSVILDPTEKAAALAAVTAYNNTINSYVGKPNVAVVDINGLLKHASQTGLMFGGQLFTGAYVTGGLFSYDGVHPSSRGSAILANAFIDVINAKWNANIGKVDVLSIPGEPMGKEALNGKVPIISQEALNNVVRLMQAQ